MTYRYLLASSYSKEGLLTLIEEFYFSSGKFKITDDYHVQRQSDNKIMEGTRVIKKGNKFLFVSND